MVKKLLFIVGCMVCGACMVLFWTRAVPPTLEWHEMGCWNNSVFQVLRNVRPLTEELLRARREADKKKEHSKYELFDDGSVDLFMKRYVDLLEIIDDSKNKKLTEEELKRLENKRSEFYKQSSVLISTKTNEKKVGLGEKQSAVFFFTFFLSNEKHNALSELLNAFFEVNQDYKVKHDHEDGVVTFGQGNRNVNRIGMENKDGFLLQVPGFTKLPKYFLLYSAVGLTATDFFLNFDLNPFVSDKLKQQGEWKYELIGMVCGYTGHFFAYLKDQFEDKPQWYRVDDLRGSRTLGPELTIKDFEQDKAQKGYIFFYKRVDTSLDNLARALASLARA